MNNEPDDLEDFDLFNGWVTVDDKGDYTAELNQRRDITDSVEDKLYNLARLYLSQEPLGEFGLSELVGHGNSNEWNNQPLSDLKNICQDDESAKCNAGMALKRALYKHDGFEMSKRSDGTNIYRKYGVQYTLEQPHD